MSYNNYSHYAGDPYAKASGAEQGYGYVNHEMQSYGGPVPAASNVLSQQEFLNRVKHVRDEMQGLRDDVAQIATLHQRALNSSDDSAQAQLEALTAQTQLRNTSIRDQIKHLQQDAARTQNGSRDLKNRQITSLSNDFKGELQRYIQEEQGYKERYRDQIARQYRIVNPEATEQEVQHAADQDWGNEGIFQMALRSNRSGQASAVLGNVRARHNELQKIEQSIVELAGIFQDLDTLVLQQEQVVKQAEEQTEQTNQNLSQGIKEVDTGIKHARNRRKLKWWCALVVFLIIVAIALGVGLGVTLTNNKTNGS